MKKIYLAVSVAWLLAGVVFPVRAQGVGGFLYDTNLQLPNHFANQVRARMEQTLFQAPRRMDIAGLPNAYQISPKLYRGGQPTEEGYHALAELGVKAVVSFRVQQPDKKLIEQAGLSSYHIPINPFLFNNQQAQEFLNIVQTTNGPIYIHCLYGSDRTGVMVALYRMLYDHWSREQALHEMKQDRFGFHPIFANLITYVEQVELRHIAPGPSEAQKTQLAYSTLSQETPH